MRISARGSLTALRSRSTRKPSAQPKAISPTTMTTNAHDRLDGEKWPVSHRAHGEAERDQRRRVVGEAFAFQNRQQPARQLEAPPQRGGRDRIRRRDDGAEHEAGRPGQPERIMRDRRDRRRGEQHAADRERQDRPQVGAEAAPAHADAGGVEQRRQQREQRQIGIERDRRHARQQRQRRRRRPA